MACRSVGSGWVVQEAYFHFPLGGGHFRLAIEQEPVLLGYGAALDAEGGGALASGRRDLQRE
jgi:hypothetical protein